MYDVDTCRVLELCASRGRPLAQHGQGCLADVTIYDAMNQPNAWVVKDVAANDTAEVRDRAALHPPGQRHGCDRSTNTPVLCWRRSVSAVSQGSALALLSFVLVWAGVCVVVGPEHAAAGRYSRSICMFPPGPPGPGPKEERSVYAWQQQSCPVSIAGMAEAHLRHTWPQPAGAHGQQAAPGQCRPPTLLRSPQSRTCAGPAHAPCRMKSRCTGACTPNVPVSWTTSPWFQCCTAD